MNLMVWLCEFQGDINGWDLRYCIGIWKVEKKGWKKLKWNEIVCKIGKLNGLEWYGMEYDGLNGLSKHEVNLKSRINVSVFG